jgi:hypothetical protein
VVEFEVMIANKLFIVNVLMKLYTSYGWTLPHIFIYGFLSDCFQFIG